MIISVPTELNCFHKDAFSSSIFTSSFGALVAGSLGTGGGASNLGGSALAATSQVGGYNGMWAGACRSVGTHKIQDKVVEIKQIILVVYL